MGKFSKQMMSRLSPVMPGGNNLSKPIQDPKKKKKPISSSMKSVSPFASMLGK